MYGSAAGHCLLRVAVAVCCSLRAYGQGALSADRVGNAREALGERTYLVVQINAGANITADNVEAALGKASEAADASSLNAVVFFSAFGHNFQLQLSQQTGLVAGTFEERWFAEGGRELIVAAKPKPCFYRGVATGLRSSYATFNLCGGVSGIITVWNDTYSIEPAPEPAKKISHYGYLETRANQPRKGCGIEKAGSRRIPLHAHGESDLETKTSNGRRRREPNADSTIRRPAGSSDKTSFVELYLVLDNAFYLKNRDQTSAKGYNIVNYANTLLRKTNVYLVLVGMEIWNDADKITVTENATETLSAFLKYRTAFITPRVHHDNAQLISGKDKFSLEQGVIGKAHIGVMCSPSSGGITLDNKNSVAAAATTMVHEMGHNFGLKHDDEWRPIIGNDVALASQSFLSYAKGRCKCDDTTGSCIMAGAVGSRQPVQWSSCSIGFLHDMLESPVRGMCLRNLPSARGATVSLNCGNYLVEEGEECDCGPPEQCDSSCCNPLTCRLLVDAVCATGECCDLSTCRLKAAATVCRPAATVSGHRGDNGQCDLPEYCTGKSEYCPADLHVRDGTPCSNANGDSYCYAGACRTRSGHCDLLYGDGWRDADPYCYERYNPLGQYYGHCGRDTKMGNFTRCSTDQVWCGQLQCDHENAVIANRGDGLVASLPSHVKLTEFSHFTDKVSRNGKALQCRIAVLEVAGYGREVRDLGMVPDGTRCGEERVCVDRRCVSASAALSANCQHGCNGHGKCNSRGNCHCHYPYAPPFCVGVGAGGSEDSGPASIYQDDQALTVGLLTTFVGLAPLLMLTAVFIYRHKSASAAAAAGLKDLRMVFTGDRSTVCRQSLNLPPPAASSAAPAPLRGVNSSQQTETACQVTKPVRGPSSAPRLPQRGTAVCAESRTDAAYGQSHIGATAPGESTPSGGGVAFRSPLVLPKPNFKADALIPPIHTTVSHAAAATKMVARGVNDHAASTMPGGLVVPAANKKAGGVSAPASNRVTVVGGMSSASAAKTVRVHGAAAKKMAVGAHTAEPPKTGPGVNTPAALKAGRNVNDLPVTKTVGGVKAVPAGHCAQKFGLPRWPPQQNSS